MAADAASPVLPAAHDAGDKGLKTGALGFVSSVVIGVARPRPATASQRPSAS